MKCEKGCGWLRLNFNKFNEVQAVNELGMKELEDKYQDLDRSDSDFLFTISKKEDSFHLNGIEGTAWLDLNFKLEDGKSQGIDQHGMVKTE